MREARRHGGHGRRGFAGRGRGLAHMIHWETRSCKVGDGGGRGME